MRRGDKARSERKMVVVRDIYQEIQFRKALSAQNQKISFLIGLYLHESAAMDTDFLDQIWYIRTRNILAGPYTQIVIDDHCRELGYERKKSV